MSMISRAAVLEALTAKVEAASYTPLRQTELWAMDPPISITDEARLPSGVVVRFITGGDSFHRGQYNGWIAAEVGGQRVGRIDYSLTGAGTDRPSYHIDMIEVDEGWRRKGIATALYERMLEDEPGNATVNPGSLLPDGAKWWPTVSTKIAMPDRDGWWYHFGAGTSRDTMGEYVHLGTRQAAIERMREVRQGGWGELVRVRIQPRNPLNSPQNPLSDNDANLMEAWEGHYPSERGQMPEIGEVQFGMHGEPAEVARRWGYRGAWIHDAIYYRNTVEDPGSISVMVDPDCIVAEEIAPPQVPGVGSDHPRLFAHKEAATPLSDERYGSPANVKGRPMGDQMIVFYNRDTDTLAFEEPMSKRPEWDFITSPNPPEGGPVKVDKEPLSITPLYNGTALALDRGFIYPATGGMNPTNPTMFSPLLTEALARLIDTFPDYGSWTVYEAPRDWAQGGRGYTARDWVYRFLDLRSAISGKQAQWKTLTLYHGTCRRYADQIMRRGLQPRDTTGVANPWGEQYASRPGLVYLSHGSRLTVTRSAMSKAAAAAGWDLYGDAMTRLTDFRYDHSRSVAENFRSAMAKLAGAATGKPKTNWTREIPPDPEADALFDRIKSDRALDPVLLEINVPREGWANFERDEDTRRYSDPGAEMTGMPAWMLSLGSDAVVAYKGTIPSAWISVAAEGAAASGAGMSSDDWSWRR